MSAQFYPVIEVSGTYYDVNEIKDDLRYTALPWLNWIEIVLSIYGSNVGDDGILYFQDWEVSSEKVRRS